MKKNIIYIALLAVASLGFSSCDSELDIAKHGNLGSMEDFYTNDENTMQATSSLYLQMRGLHYNWFMTKNCLSDDVWTGGGSRGDNAEMEKLNEYTFGTDHGMIQSLYSGLYGVIYKANLIIDKVQGDTPIMKRAVNEAKVFRAWASFELVTLFGTAPVVDHLLEPGEYRLGNSAPADMWALIESDLNDAINSGTLPSKSDVNDAEGGIRITKETAQALDNVINSGKYALYQGEYDAQFHAAANNNCESVFELQKRNDTEQMWNQFDMGLLMQGWRTDKMNYSGQAAAVIAQGTYGFMNPRKSLYDAFVAWEGANGYRLNKTMMTYEQLKNFGVSIQTGALVYGCEGYFMWKNQSLKEDCVVDQSFFQGVQFTNLKIMRYAEVLLLAAEAQLQAGNSSKALDYINQIRIRAKETPLTSVTLNDIKTEKRLELCNESVRFQDLVRWGDAESALGQQGKEIPAFGTEGVQWLFKNDKYGFKSKHKLLPIPLKEIELNPNMTQNAEW